MKTHYSVQELEKLQLPGLPQKARGLYYYIERNKWAFKDIPAACRGGFRREFFPPVEVQKLIRERESQALIASVSDLPMPESAKLADAAQKAQIELMRRQVLSHQLTEAQRRCSAARCSIVAHVLQVAMLSTQREAVEHVVEAACAGELPEHLQALVCIANARSKGEARLSRTRVYEWLSWYLKAQNAVDRLRWLAPVVRQKDMSIPPWAFSFLKLFRKPHRPEVTTVQRQLVAELGEQAPSVGQIHRFMKKLAPEVLYRGRMTGAALKAMMPYVKRDTSKLKPNDAWMGDGHGFKALVEHPEHGKPFRPEVTLIMDVASRVIVGWSVSLSESCIAVADALRHGMTHHPVPAIYYSDNGGGQTNKTFDEPVVGVLSRIGIVHALGRPGNPQGRGMVERLHQTVLIKLANSFGTSQTSHMDRDTLRLVSRHLQGGQNALDQGKTPSDKQQAALNKMPTWSEFVHALKLAIDDYNQNHEHRSLPKVDGKHMTPQQFYDMHADNSMACRLGADELRDMFRPMQVRRATRGMVRLLRNEYFHPDLMLVDGQDVQVSYDIHDAQRVIVRDMDGRFVCEAEFERNKRGFFPEAFVDIAKERRTQGREKRLQRGLDEVRAEHRGTLNLSAEPQNELLSELNTRVLSTQEQDAARVQAQLLAEYEAPKTEAFTLPSDMESRYRLWLRLEARLERGEGLDEREHAWWKSFRQTSEWSTQKMLFDEFGLAVEA